MCMTKHKVLVLSFLDVNYISIVCVQNSFVFGVYVFEQSTNYNSTFFKNCLIIILGDFNVDILESNNHTKYKQELLNFMEKFEFKS
jgi:hypothetical protein